MNTVLRNLKVISIFAVLVFAIFFPTQTHAVTLQKSQLNTNSNLRNGLVGYWTFDGADVTTRVFDRSGSGYNGAYYGAATSSAKVIGKIGQALTFTADNSYVELPLSAPNLSPGTGDFSFAAWVKWGGSFNGNDDFIIEDRGGSSQDYQLGVISNNRLECRFTDGTNAATADTVTDYLLTAANGWHYYVCVKSGTTVNLYGDNVLIATGSNASLGNVNTDGTWNPVIGSSIQETAEAGVPIDEVRVYNRALSATERTQLYNLGKTVAQKNLESKNTGLKNGLVAYYPFDGPDVTTSIFDRSGNGNNGFWTGPSGTITSTSSAKVLGKVGQAFNFDGVDDSIETTDMTALEGAAHATWSAWIKPISLVDSTMYFGKYKSNDGAQQSWMVGVVPAIYGVGSNEVAMWFTSSEICATNDTNPLVAGQWVHVTFVYDGTQTGDSNRLNIYINGVKESTILCGHGSSVPATLTATIWPMTLGGSVNGAFYTNAILDEVRIWNRTLSAAEVKQVYNLGQTVAQKNLESKNTGLKSGLVGYWTFDGPDVTDKVYDRSGQGHNGGWYGTGSGSITSTSSAKMLGKIGQALNFDGTDDYVDTGSDFIGTTNAITFSAWIKPRSFGGGGAGTIASNNSFIFRVRSAGNYLEYRGDGNIGNDSADNSITLNTWQFVTVTRVGTTVNFYVNGTLSGTANQTGDVPTVGSRNVFFGNNFIVSNAFDGVIDEVRVYNRALSATEIKQLYNLGK